MMNDTLDEYIHVCLSGALVYNDEFFVNAAVPTGTNRYGPFQRSFHIPFRVSNREIMPGDPPIS